MDPIDTAEVYEIVVERHRRASTILTSNRDPGEMLAQMADPLLAQSAIDRLHSTPTNSSSTASPTGDANDPPLTPATPPNHHHHADTDTPDPVPSH